MSHSESFIESVTRWTTDSVKAELRNNKLSQAGNKNQLVTRLQQLYRRQAVSGQPINNQTPIPNPATSSTGIQQTANSNQIQHGARDNNDITHHDIPENTAGAAGSGSLQDLPTHNRPPDQCQNENGGDNHQQLISMTPLGLTRSRADNLSTSLQIPISIPTTLNLHTVSSSCHGPNPVQVQTGGASHTSCGTRGYEGNYRLPFIYSHYPPGPDG